MTFAVIDTLKFANALKAAGVPPERAEAQALMFGELMKFYLDERAENIELKREVENLRSELHELRTRGM